MKLKKNFFSLLIFDNVYFMTTTEEAKHPMVLSGKLGNVPESGFAISLLFCAEQLYYVDA